MQVNAAVLYQTNSKLKVETLELAAPKAGEVLVKIAAAGVCHSDYHVVTGQAKQTLPAVLGHEGAGIVTAIGEGVSKVKVGDHVVLNWIPYCGQCHLCQNSKTHLCKAYVGPMWDGTMLDGTCRLSKDGQPYYHLGMLACWADHTVLPEQCCVVIKKEVPFEVAALLGCAVTTGVGAAVNRAKVKPGSKVVVFGAGGVGLSVIMGAHLSGAAKIIAVDRFEDKAELAKSFGATHFVTANANSDKEILNLTEGHGADYVFEAVGNTKLQAACLELVSPGGMLVFVGLAGNDETVALPSASIIRDEKVVTGSIFGSAQTDRDFNLFGELFLQGKLPVDRLVSKKYSLEQINEACDAMLSGEVGRGVIVFDD